MIEKANPDSGGPEEPPRPLGSSIQASHDGSVERQHLNQAQLARLWGLSPRTLERWRWLGKGPPYLRIGRVRYRLSDVVEFEQANFRCANPRGEGHGR